MNTVWRNNKYGRLTGAQVESCLSMFHEVWAERAHWADLRGDEEKQAVALQRLMAIPSWTVFYQDSLIELLAKISLVAGVSAELLEVSGSEDPVAAALAIAGSIPDDAPDHPAALPLAFAMVGNLDAIARYSRSVNDMISACRGGDISALYQALSVDSYISTMPIFQAAMRLGQLSDDSSMAASIFKAVKGPHKKRFDYPLLRWAEYLLRDQGAFESCTREEIYDLVVIHLGIYDPAGAKKDPKAALFTLFRAWQKGAGIQNPRFGFSGKRK